MERIMPRMMVAYTSMEKYSLALSFFPSPNVFATMALPPVPIMNPKDASPITIGSIRLIEARAVLPAKLDTKNPSTML